jgi:predicted nucleic acid-binding protein
VLLLDASVWIASKDPDDRYFSAARPLVLESDEPLAALDLTLYEVGNTIGARWQRPKEAHEVCQTVIGACGDRLVAVDVPLIDSALEIAATHGLTAYDAAYVAAARRHGWTLVSADIADLVSKGLAVAPGAANYP